ncbi:MAG TPA: hypothetical protein VMU67_03695 [Steroidobacteraceae bacterium]|nr:hypothetical protein [Steroidobacteraceae bacterium]
MTRFARGAAVQKDEEGVADASETRGGILYLNSARRRAGDADLTGTIALEGELFRVAARWLRARDGSRALRLKFARK